MAKRGRPGGKDRRRIWRALVRRQGRRCFYCQKFVAQPVKGTVVEKGEKLWGTFDHLIPRALGGSNEVGNLLLACYICHQKRHAEE